MNNINQQLALKSKKAKKSLPQTAFTFFQKTVQRITQQKKNISKQKITQDEQLNPIVEEDSIQNISIDSHIPNLDNSLSSNENINIAIGSVYQENEDYQLDFNREKVLIIKQNEEKLQTKIQFNGQYVIGVRDNFHLYEISQTENFLFKSFLFNHCPVVYINDINFNQSSSIIAIIPDYLNDKECIPKFNRKRQQSNSLTGILWRQYFQEEQEYQKNPYKLHQNSWNLEKSKSSPYSEYQVGDEEKNLSMFRSQCLVTKDKLVQQNKVMGELNLDSSCKNYSQDEDECTTLRLSQNSKIDENQVILKSCCQNVDSFCRHNSRIAYITIKQLRETMLTSNDVYYFNIVLSAQSKIFSDDLDLINNCIEAYLPFKQDIQRSKKIIQRISKWISLKQMEIIKNEFRLIFKKIEQLILIAKLFNYKKSKKQEKLLSELENQINQIKQKKKDKLMIDWNEIKSRKLQNKIQDLDSLTLYKKKSQNCFWTPKVQHNTMLLDEQFELSKLQDEQMDLLPKNIDWICYVEKSLNEIQQNLWLIDLELFASLNIDHILNPKLDIKERNKHEQANLFIYLFFRSIVQKIANHFDMLFYHILLSIINCPMNFQFHLFTRLINLGTLSLQEKHYQLSYLLYNVFSHDITKYYLNKNLQLSFLVQQELKKIQRFGQNKQQYLSSKNKELRESDEIEIPCMGWIQQQLNKIEMNQQIWKVVDQNKYINFCYLEEVSALMFPIINLQLKVNSSDQNIYQNKIKQNKQSKSYQFYTQQLKPQLMRQLNITNEKVIEIELFKLKSKKRISDFNY